VSSLQVGSSKEDPAIGFAPAVNHEDPASRASHGLSVANNHLIQSRRSEVAAACSTPAVRRPNDAEIEQPPAKRVKTNEGRPSARKSAENSEEVTNPLGSVVQLRSDNGTMANQDISATRRRNKNRATVAEKDSVNDGSHEQDLVTFDFFIPGSEFDLVTINGRHWTHPHSFLDLPILKGVFLFCLKTLSEKMGRRLIERPIVPFALKATDTRPFISN
jgi:hypothetical protein